MTKNKHEEFCLNVKFEEIPTQDEIELLIDITGEMDCDLIFKNTTYEYLVTKESIDEIFKSINDFYLVYARNEDSDRSDIRNDSAEIFSVPAKRIDKNK